MVSVISGPFVLVGNHPASLKYYHNKLMVFFSLTDQVPRVLRDGIRCRRRPDDAHSRRRLLRAQGRLLHGVRCPRIAIPPRKQNYLQVTFNFAFSLRH